MNISILNDPIPPSAVTQRQQSGVTLDYLEGWYVIDRLNKAFGPLGWQKEVAYAEKVQCEQYKNANGKELWKVGYVAKVTLTVGDEKAKKEDCGFGQGIDSDSGKAHESAIKEAVTDALKRCAKDLGMSMGLALYDKKKANVSNPSIAAQAPLGPPVKVVAWLRSKIVAEDDSTLAKNVASGARSELWGAFQSRFGADAEKVLLGCDDLEQAESAVREAA